MVGAGIATLALFASASFDDIAPWSVLLGLRLIIAGIGLVLATRALPPGELGHLGRMLRPLALPALVMIVWAIVQCLPLSSWANPVWSSAAAALPDGVAGHITVDLQATVFSLFQVAAAALVVLLVGLQTADRTRAEDALVVIGASALILPALGQLLQRFGSAFDAVNQAAALDCLIIVPTMACAWGDLALERYETRRAGQARARQNVLAIVAACAVVALCCLAAVGLIGGTGAILAAATGIVIFFSIVLSRRFGWGLWLIAAMLVVLLFAFVAVATNAFGTAQTALAGSWAPNGIERQMLRDAPLVGTGLGTSAILSNLYRTLEDVGVFTSTSAAVRGMVELGAPVFWCVVASFAVIEWFLIRDAMRRGRDSVYAVLAASVLPSLLVIAFINVGMVDWDVIVVAGGILGLGLSQRQGRTVVR